MIALVDDDIDDLELLQDAISGSDYSGECMQFHTGQELMDFLRSQPSRPEVITLDLNMPVKNGFQALAEIKSDPDLRSIPVIIVSASSNKMDEVQCLELGCEKFFRKPATMRGYDQLISVVLGYVQH